MTFSVVDIFVYIIRRWWKMLIALAVFAGLGVVLAFTLPKRYRAEVKILPMAQESGLMGALSSLQSQLGISSLSIPSAEGSMILIYGEILRSHTIFDQVIDSCSLMEKFNAKSREEAYSELEAMTAYNHTPEQVFIIEVVGPDPKLVAEIANSEAYFLDKYMKNSTRTKGRNLREFVETRLAQVEKDLKTAQDSLSDFQRKHALPIINPEAGTGIQEYAELSAEAMKKELEMDYMRQFSTINNPQYETTRRELAVIRSKLASLPPLASRYFELYRDYRIQEEIYLLLMQQYEQAKLMEAKDTPVISIMEWAKPPTVAFFPPKKIIVLAMVVVGIVLIIAWVMLRVYWEHVVSFPEAHKHLSRVRGEFKDLAKRKKR